MQFNTSVSGEVNGELTIRGTSLVSMIGEVGYTQALFFILTGKKPTQAQLAILDVILVACMDHGIAPASGFVPRVVTASGNETTHAMAAGLLALGPFHGGAVEDAMCIFVELNGKSEQEITTYIKTQRAAHKRLSGFGHRKYTETDPRTEKLFAIATTQGQEVGGAYIKTARDIELALAKVMGRKLVLNVDGAVAALLLELGLPVEAGNGIFALARMAGMLAHIIEEKQQGNVVRRLDDDEVTYTE